METVDTTAMLTKRKDANFVDLLFRVAANSQSLLSSSDTTSTPATNKTHERLRVLPRPREIELKDDN